MRVYSCHQFELPLPSGHRFPMAKYRLLHERVAQHAERLGIALCEPPAASDADLLRAHDSDYVERLSRGIDVEADMRRIGFPWSTAMIERSRRSSGATTAALCDAIAGGGIGINLAGGTHHAAHARGGGYCVFNDSVVAARYVQAQGLARRLLVIDLDVHQGDGTASICAGDPSVYTFSVHGARNYPAIKPASDLDVALPDGCDDARYLDALAQHLPLAFSRARPDAAIFLAGADPFHGDRLGLLGLSKAGLRERDRMVFEACRRERTPLAVSMAGGYAERIDDIVDIHFATVELAAGYAADHAASSRFARGVESGR